MMTQMMKRRRTGVVPHRLMKAMTNKKNRLPLVPHYDRGKGSSVLAAENPSITHSTDVN
jgi:hypothetical protein